MNDLPPDAATAAPVEPAKPEPALPPAKKITNILEFQEIIDEKFTTVITYQSKRVEMEGRRLKPFETQQLVDMMAAVLPPSVKGRTPQEDRYDYDNKEYRAKKEEARLTARAIGIYTAFPAVSAARPNLTKPEQIREFVQGMLTDAILETLWQTVQDGGVRKAEYLS